MGAKPTKSTPDNITLEEVSLSDFEIDFILSGRTVGEISKNAKELQPLIEARGEWDKSQPGQYFVRNGKKHLLVGFTRVHACKNIGIKKGWFFEVKDDPALNRTACLRTNAGQNISPLAQGMVFLAMRNGSDPKTLKKGEIALEPMGPYAIAQQLGYSKQWVQKAIALAESPEDVRDMILNDEVAANIVYDAAKLAKGGKGSQKKILQRCIEEAKKEGKTKATEKHFKLIKSEFEPDLKADTSVKKKGAQGQESEPANPDPVKATDIDPASGASGPDEPEAAEKPEKPSVEQPDSVLALGTPAADNGKSAKDEAKDFRKKFSKVMKEWGEERAVSWSDDDFAVLLDMIKDTFPSIPVSPI